MASKQWKEDNRNKQLAYQKEHYEKNKQAIIEKNTQRKRELREWFEAYKRTLVCERCPENHPSCLDFHHLDPNEKDLDVAMAVHAGRSREKILAEVAKCVVLCANCHRKLHYNLRKLG